MDASGLSQTATNVAVGGLVLALTQATKRWTPEGWGPIIAAIWTTMALGVWVASQSDWPPLRSTYFDILAVWVSVYTTALGLYSAAMVPSGSRQSIGTGNGHADAGNTPVGEAVPAVQTMPTVDEIADELERRREERVQARLREVSEQDAPTTDDDLETAITTNPPHTIPPRRSNPRDSNLISQRPHWMPPTPREGQG